MSKEVKTRGFQGMTLKDKWCHLKKLVECAIRSNEINRPQKPVQYCQGKAQSYRTILGWMIDMEHNQALMSDGSTMINKSNEKKYIDKFKVQEEKG